ncbi:hypothetical protein [Pseudofrankia sp. BMG5.36]|uniref:hypothetical protein n=1 Tax=Pseudofrankia sp. BMG5.36 TaxID=1834512 RepID=UPI0008DA3609|nr:hypothetical protein [Pseudofrankia sp. BMG5.36]OHV74732.1 hypothetical protein BCD48_31825 [Pseudofrankia sp. BMG5.36]
MGDGERVHGTGGGDSLFRADGHDGGPSLPDGRSPADAFLTAWRSSPAASSPPVAALRRLATRRPAARPGHARRQVARRGRPSSDGADGGPGTSPWPAAGETALRGPAADRRGDRRSSPSTAPPFATPPFATPPFATPPGGAPPGPGPKPPGAPPGRPGPAPPAQPMASALPRPDDVAEPGPPNAAAAADGATVFVGRLSRDAQFHVLGRRAAVLATVLLLAVIGSVAAAAVLVR